MLWILVAWLVGTIVFEVAVIGADAFDLEHKPDVDTTANSTKTPSQNLDLFKRLMKDELEYSIATTRLESLPRIEHSRLLRHSLNQIISTEQVKLAMLESMRGADKLPADFNVDPNSAATDPILAALPVTEGIVKGVYNKLNENVESSSIAERTRVMLTWNQAQKSSLPGLVRLTGHAFPPVYVSNVPDTSESKPPLQTVVAEPAASSTDKNKAIGKTASFKANRDKLKTDSIPLEPPAITVAAKIPKITTPKAQTTPRLTAPKLVSPPTQDVYIAPPVLDIATMLPVGEPIRQPDPPQPYQSAAPIQQPLETVSVPELRVAARPQFPEPAQDVMAPALPAVDEGVTLSVDSTDVRSVLELLARGYNMNIMIAPEVTGTVTANVNGLNPDQALRSVLKMCNLRAEFEDNVIYIYAADKLPAESRQLRMFPLDFAKAEVLEATIQMLLSPTGTASITSLDQKDNMKTREAIVVVDTPEAIQRVESFLHQADQPPRQVMIEARILEVELRDDMMHGVNFDALFRGDLTIGSFGLADPIGARTNPLFFAEIDGSRVKSLIDLLETTTDSKTLAAPKIMVVNGQEAKIQVGQQLGFSVATVTQTSTIQDVQFLDTGVVLSVTPTISRDNRVLLHVKPEVSDGQINPTTLLPEEETRELETSVLLNDHQGVVIGGLIQERDDTVIRKLPFLGDVKYVGKLFQRRETSRSRSEIVVALIPHIVELDQCHQPVPQDCEELNRDFQRTDMPLFYGPLQRACRPEPRLPDQVGAEQHLDANKINRMLP